MTTTPDPESIRREVEGQIEAWLRDGNWANTLNYKTLDPTRGFMTQLADAIARGEHRTTPLPQSEPDGWLCDTSAGTLVMHRTADPTFYEDVLTAYRNSGWPVTPYFLNAAPPAAQSDRIRAEVIEECATVAETTRGGFTKTFAAPAEPHEEGEELFVRDKDGPWVLNADVAAAIRALSHKGETKP